MAFTQDDCRRFIELVRQRHESAIVILRALGLISVLCYFLHFVSYWRLTPELRVAPTRTEKKRTVKKRALDEWDGGNDFGVGAGGVGKEAGGQKKDGEGLKSQKSGNYEEKRKELGGTPGKGRRESGTEQVLGDARTKSGRRGETIGHKPAAGSQKGRSSWEKRRLGINSGEGAKGLGNRRNIG